MLAFLMGLHAFIRKVIECNVMAYTLVGDCGTNVCSLKETPLHFHRMEA